MQRASELERRALNDSFSRLCSIASPFGEEGQCARHVRRELEQLGLDVDEDNTAKLTGAGAGNLLVRVPGRAERSVMLCAHLDTVAVTAPIEPVVIDGGWCNAHDAILGADNKAAVAVLLALAHRARTQPLAMTLELVFTVSEENALAGAKAFDVGRLESDFGYVFDHASPIGEVVIASPTYFRLEADFHGAAAHAGIRPEAGRSAIEAAARAIAALSLGRLDEETTANVGAVHGGEWSTNVVPERCRLLAEARSLDAARAEQVIAEMVDHIHDAANVPACQCDVDVTVGRLFCGYRSRPSEPHVAAAEAALRACGYEPTRITTGGGSDANAFQAQGFSCANLANGTERNHQPDERVSVAALEGMLDVALALLDSVAAT